MEKARVVLFSNGIGDFHKVVKVNGRKEISIPVKTSYIGDVLNSFNVSGDVIFDPPTFKTEKDAPFSLNPNDVYHDLIKNLSGAKVIINDRPGILIGTHVEQQPSSGKPYEQTFVLYFDELGCLKKIPYRDVTTLKFEGEAQAEVEKILRRQFEKIKPDSTFLELSLTSNKETEAIVQYSLPVASWASTYRLRNSDTGVEIQGFAVVHNNTDEDWTDVFLTVVTGDPVTFSTDLATPKLPARSHVNATKDRAADVVELSAMNFADGGLECASPMMACSTTAKRSLKAATFGAAGSSLRSATFSEAKIEEAGDFSIFSTEKPITIKANQSSLVPLFTSKSPDSRVVLHYKSESGRNNPHRCIEFKNSSEFTLGRGPCSVYSDGLKQGDCVLPSTKSKTQCLLPHAIENGVRVTEHDKTYESKKSKLKFSKGICYTTTVSTTKSLFHVVNQLNDSFTSLIDFNRQWANSKLSTEDSVKIVDSKEGYCRLEFILNAKQEKTIVLEETHVQESELNLKDNFNYFYRNDIVSNSNLMENEEINKCVVVQQKIDELSKEIETNDQKINELTTLQERIRANLEPKGLSENLIAKWSGQLETSEDEIQSLTKINQDLDSKINTLQTKLNGLIKSIVVEI